MTKPAAVSNSASELRIWPTKRQRQSRVPEGVASGRSAVSPARETAGAAGATVPEDICRVNAAGWDDPRERVSGAFAGVAASGLRSIAIAGDPETLGATGTGGCAGGGFGVAAGDAGGTIE